MSKRLFGSDLPRQRKVKMPVNFRPTEKRAKLVELIRQKLDLKTRTEALEAAIDIAAKQLRVQ